MGCSWTARVWAVALVALLAGSRGAVAQQGATPRLEVWMMTFGPGQQVFLKFGHNAVLVRGRDPATGEVRFERVYDYGLFDGSSPTLVADFLQGRMQYWMGVTTLRSTMHRYRRTNRDVYAQKLRLTQAQALELLRRLEDNARPENKFYRYDYYYDNCSTRVRDVLDAITGGAVKAAFVGPATMNLRDHSLRHTADDWMYYLGLDVALANVDAPIDLWVESFLPFKFSEALRKVRVNIDGTTVPLVEKEEVWFDGTRPEIPDAPPNRILAMTLVGLCLGGLLAALGWWARTHLFVRRAFVVLASVLGFSFAFFGVLLVFLWGFTDHSIAYGNENIFHLAPFALLTPFAAVASRRPGRRYLFAVLGAAAVLSLLGLMVKVLPGFDQGTYRIIGLLLPIWSGLALGAWWVAERPD